MEKVKFLPAGDSSVLIEFGNSITPEINAQVTSFAKLLKRQEINGIIDMIPSFCALMVNYSTKDWTYDQLVKILEELLKNPIDINKSEPKIIEIPVYYGGEDGPDLELVAQNSGLSEDEVIKLHSGKDYLIYMIGFMPGFPYLGGLDEKIHTPRLKNPRLKITAGSVGIGGAQTGIYPIESPGGWNLIGRTDVQLYNPNNEQMVLFEAGDYIRFIPIK